MVVAYSCNIADMILHPSILCKCDKTISRFVFCCCYYVNVLTFGRDSYLIKDSISSNICLLSRPKSFTLTLFIIIAITWSILALTYGAKVGLLIT